MRQAADARTIGTPRLILRPHRPGDHAAMVALWRQPAVYGPITGAPPAPEDLWHKLLRFAGHWALFGYGMFVVEDRATRAFVGEVGLADFRRGLGPGFDGPAEAAWVMDPAAQGRGLAHEAMAAVLGRAAAQGIAGRAVCMIGEGNAPSLRLAGRLGFARFADAAYRGRPVHLLERPLPGGGEAVQAP